jgi:methionyl-tRNA formyltransferase
MRVIFFGIYEFGLYSLKALVAAGHEPIAVVTKPTVDVEVPALVEWAVQRGIPVLQPESPALPWFVERLKILKADLNFVAGYHKRIPAEVLNAPAHGTLNLHGSLLPRYRGPSTWKQAIMNGETVTGVTVHVMTPKLDAGDILLQTSVPIDERDTGGSLFLKICEAGAKLLPLTIEGLVSNTIVPRKQEEENASYYGYVTDAEAAIDWNSDARDIVNLTRALNPRPGAWVSIRGLRYRIGSMTKTSSVSIEAPGRIVGFESGQLIVASGTEDVLVTDIIADMPVGKPTCHQMAGIGDQFDVV